MTCSVGVVDEEGVVIGGDSLSSDGSSVIVRRDPKVFRVGEFLIGFTSSYRMGQLLRFSLKPPKLAVGGDVERYMNTDFIDAVRDCFRDGGYLTVEDSQESGGIFLAGFRGRLFRVGSDFQVGESWSGLAAIGSGDEVATGALYAAKKIRPDMQTEQLALLALDAAEANSCNVREPFLVMRLPNGRPTRGKAKAKG